MEKCIGILYQNHTFMLQTSLCCKALMPLEESDKSEISCNKWLASLIPALSGDINQLTGAQCAIPLWTLQNWAVAYSPTPYKRTWSQDVSFLLAAENTKGGGSWWWQKGLGFNRTLKKLSSIVTSWLSIYPFSIVRQPSELERREEIDTQRHISSRDQKAWAAEPA